MSYNTILATAPLTTQNYHLKMIGTSIGNSLIWDNGTNVGIGNTNTSYKLDVSGTGRFTGSIDLTNGISLASQFNIFTNNQATNNITLAQGFATTTDNIGYLYNRATADFVFGTSNAERMRITSAGFVGIGTSSPLNVLDVRQASAAMGNYQTIQAFSTDSAAINLGGGISLGGYHTGTTSIAQFGSIVGRKENGTSGNYDGYLAFGTNAQATGVVERMRITSAGYVLIGTSTSTGLGVSRFQLAGTSTTAQILITNTAGGYASTYSTSSDVYMGRIDNGSSTLYIGTGPLNGASFNNQLSISGSGLVSIASNVEIGNGYLSTSAGSGTAYSSRLSTEYTYPYIDTFLDSIAGASYQSRLRFRLNGAAGAMEDKLILWYDGTITFSGLAGSGTRNVTVTAGGNLSTSSDSKLKQEDKEYAIGGLKELLQITPRAYKWLDDIEKRGEEAVTELGFFADEVAPIIPSAAPKGNDDMYGFNDRALMAVMVKSIQELTERLNKLENK